MDGKKQMGSSSSFTTDLFGSTESSASSSSGIFGSIFAPSSKVFGRESLRSEAVGMKQDSANQVPWSSGGEYQNVPNKDSNPYYQEQRVQPCHLSSSIYYGGQDVYSHPQKTQPSGYSTVNNEGGEDDLGIASRGNWWQGSLYY
ncbi:uncharacterized protein LOC131324794 isoform X3 [Rhododendron vialii]|uniref:uncharacterized protein LOC131324794 isoform X3 n=1 Tax=Rhododendron vialii TaxID=182163 RepID=UPI00265D7219|nr:uncharacterized protein LOC131324794 isoform X3 [Rhododendron vialii]